MMSTEQESHGSACPNPGFINQLKLWQILQYSIKLLHPNYRQIFLEFLALEFFTLRAFVMLRCSSQSIFKKRTKYQYYSIMFVNQYFRFSQSFVPFSFLIIFLTSLPSIYLSSLSLCLSSHPYEESKFETTLMYYEALRGFVII